MYTRILIAIDGSDLSLRGLEHGLSLAAHLGAKVDIVTVSEPWAGGMADVQGWAVGYEAGPEYRAEREQSANAILQPALDRAAEMEVEAEPVHVLDRYAADGILETALERGSDLVVMTSHGRRGLTRVLLGSQSAEVVTRSTVPVLVVR
ncbi:universal stress protein [Pseudoxanthomonas sp.]|uniref:universal stress protein n=1 Tax=Pseudoxanthomonas sp. TaxID=1871049 RepID=UPI00260E12C0|nr:universal stress protein [Pseudoxanthomonas sp.]WDS34905.1 MAG: universal stress protein [Pseudoxanthomonas sp.]